MSFPHCFVGFQSTSHCEPELALAYLNTPLMTTESGLSLGVECHVQNKTMGTVPLREFAVIQIPKLRARQAQAKGLTQISLYQVWI